MRLKELKDEVSEHWNSAVCDGTLIAYNTALKSFKTFLLLNNITGSVKSLPEVPDFFSCTQHFVSKHWALNIAQSNCI